MVLLEPQFGPQTQKEMPSRAATVLRDVSRGPRSKIVCRLLALLFNLRGRPCLVGADANLAASTLRHRERNRGDFESVSVTVGVEKPDHSTDSKASPNLNTLLLFCVQSGHCFDGSRDLLIMPVLIPRFGESPTEEGIPDYGISDPLINYLTVQFNVYLNIFSIIGGLIVVLITFFLWIYDFRLVNRVSLRLNFAISAIDIIKAALIYSYTFADNSSGWWCGFSVWFITWLTILYLLLNVAIAFNLQWIILLQRPLHRWMERGLYFLGSLLLSLAITLPPYLTGNFGFDRAQGTCWYVDSWTPTSKLWQWFTFLVPSLFSILYCTVVVAFVVLKIWRDNRELNKHIQASDDILPFQHRTRLAVNRVLARIVLYPLIPLVTQSLLVASEIYIHATGQFNQVLSVFGNAGTDLPGVFNCIAFLVDPAVANAFSKIRRDLVERYSGNKGAVEKEIKFYKARVWFVRTFLMPPKGKENINPSLSGHSREQNQLASLPSHHEIIPPKRKTEGHLDASHYDDGMEDIIADSVRVEPANEIGVEGNGKPAQVEEVDELGTERKHVAPGVDGEVGEKEDIENNVSHLPIATGEAVEAIRREPSRSTTGETNGSEAEARAALALGRRRTRRLTLAAEYENTGTLIHDL
ncbi:uncharacterized protein VTP21DRAFT_5577 [Calcarisporiella thermophila]|uniref:uncharacterized protein n=1 Tax=Calcarisporiella thermophila TaxID=911321 RepID=UPI0037425744